jgi:hypothetical protein
MPKTPKPPRAKDVVFPSPRTMAEDPTAPSGVEIPYAEHKKANEPHSFRPPASSNSHGYKGTQKHGALRLSGHSGAHQLGRK